MGRQIRIPGTEQPVDEEIAAAGDKFAKAGSKAKKAGTAKKEAGDALVQLMLKKKVRVYRDLEADPPIEIDLGDPKYTVKVKTINHPDDPSESATQPPAKA